MYCDLLKMAFLAVPERFQVVACASKTAEILAMIQQHQPTVAIISDSLEEGPLAGLKILPEVRRANPDTRILMALGSSDKELVIGLSVLARTVFFAGAALSSCCASPWMHCRRTDLGECHGTALCYERIHAKRQSSARSIRRSKIA